MTETRSPLPAGETGSPLIVVNGFDPAVFAATHWNHSPVLFKGVDPAPFDAAEVFDGAVAACSSATDHTMPYGVEFSIDAYQPLESHGRLPRRQDGSLDGYADRIHRELPNQRHQLAIHGFHAHAPALWRRERDFCGRLWEHTGQPAHSVITTLFHGNYSHTAVGVHKDSYATFMFALRGRKRMRFWPERPWPHPVSTILDYEPYLDTSFTAEAEPGDLLYWPADYYHVGESDLSEEPATSVNIGVGQGRFTARAIPALLAADDRFPSTADAPVASLRSRPLDTVSVDTTPVDGQTPAAPPSGRTTPATQPGAPETPAELYDALHTFRSRATGRRGALRTAALNLEYATAAGLHPAPTPAVASPVTDRDRLRALDPIHWARHDDTTLCAANGLVTSTPLSPDELATLLRLLPPGGPARPVRDLVGHLTDGHRVSAARDLLSVLVSFRALTLDDASAQRPDGDST